MCIEPPRPPAAAVLAPEQLGHDRVRAGAARERVAVGAVGGDQVVAVAQRPRRADDRRLLADRQVQEAADLGLGVHLAGALLEAPDQRASSPATRVRRRVRAASAPRAPGEPGATWSAIAGATIPRAGQEPRSGVRTGPGVLPLDDEGRASSWARSVRSARASRARAAARGPRTATTSPVAISTTSTWSTRVAVGEEGRGPAAALHDQPVGAVRLHAAASASRRRLDRRLALVEPSPASTAGTSRTPAAPRAAVARVQRLRACCAARRP